MIEAVVGIGAFVLILMGLPLFVGFGLLSILCYHYIAQIEIASMIAEFYRFVGAPGVMAIPLFAFSGYLLAESGAPKDSSRSPRRSLDGCRPGLRWSASFLALSLPRSRVPPA